MAQMFADLRFSSFLSAKICAICGLLDLDKVNGVEWPRRCSWLGIISGGGVKC